MNICYHNRDRVPTYLVAEWDAKCTMWDGDAISGPVPTLYADKIEVAKRAIMADPVKAHQVYKLASKNRNNEQFSKCLANLVIDT
jgi:hypothetical protein